MSKLLSLILSVILALTSTSTSAQPSDVPLVSYVVNINTGKFHIPECRYVDNIKITNRRDFDGSRDELIEQGYVPCKYCNP